MDKPTPRINSSLREKYIDKTVRLTGKLLTFSGDTALVEATDGGQVLVKLNKQSSWNTAYIEIIGRIEKDFSIFEYKSTPLGDQFGRHSEGSTRCDIDLFLYFRYGIG
ncbi:hypothetical protein BDF14DRAFT_1716545 [Spinellus fusiger]|nr:hypothetical protein BDF14DRAFT_1716545 [Spinellus fusiger]